MSYRPSYYDARPRRRVNRLLLNLTIFVWLLVVACIALRGFAVPAVQDLFNRRAAQAINPGIQLPSDPRDAVATAIGQAPILVPSLQSGTFQITEEQATAYMSNMRGQLGVDSITVHFVPDQVLSTIGVSAPIVGQVEGTVRSEARAENGRVVLANPQIDGPIGAVVSIDTLVSGLENRLNSEVAAQGRQVTDIDIQQGVAIVTVQ